MVRFLDRTVLGQEKADSIRLSCPLSCHRGTNSEESGCRVYGNLVRITGVSERKEKMVSKLSKTDRTQIFAMFCLVYASTSGVTEIRVAAFFGLVVCAFVWLLFTEEEKSEKNPQNVRER